MKNLKTGTTYFHWLTDQTYLKLEEFMDVASTVRMFELMQILHSIEFVWFVMNDDNRASDGKYLRTIFLEEYPQFEDALRSEFDIHPCTWLEMLIALASRMSFITSKTVGECFLYLLRNLGFISTEEYLVQTDEEFIRHFCEIVNNRQYGANGQGGLFPLKEPTNPPQTEVEIWDQMHAWIHENLSPSFDDRVGNLFPRVGWDHRK